MRGRNPARRARVCAGVPTRFMTADPSNASRPGWTLRPGAEVVALSLRWAATLCVLFAILYGGVNWVTAQRTDRLRLWFDAELAIPLVPWMVWPYLSLFATFFLPMFALDAARIRTLCRRLMFATATSAVLFLLFPAESGYGRIDAVPGHAAVFALLHAIDLPHNLAPSLHVSWATILLTALREPSPTWLRAGLSAWLTVLVASVVLTHQHHLLDVGGGMLVAWAAHAAIRADGRWNLSRERTS